MAALRTKDGNVLIAVAGSPIPADFVTLPSEQLFFAPPLKATLVLGLVMRCGWFREIPNVNGVSRGFFSRGTRTCSLDWSELNALKRGMDERETLN